MSRHSMVRLGAFLDPERDEVVVEPTASYETAGIYSFGRGLFHRPPISGVETSYRTFFRLHRGQFVYSRLFAWEGALAVVPPEFEGLCVSAEFPTFAIDGSRALPEYVAMLCRWPQLHEALRRETKGLGVRRKRVNAEQLLAVDVPLPASLDEQRRLVDLVNGVSSRIGLIEASERRIAPRGIAAMLPALLDTTLRQLASGQAPVDHLVELVSDIVHPGDDPSPAESFVGLQHVESHTGRRIGELPLGGEKGRKFRFRPGDVVYGYLRPYLNKVWVADRHGLCSVDQYVLRVRNGFSPALVGHALRSRSFLDEAIRLTHSLQLPRLRSGLLAKIEIPLVEPKLHRSAETALNGLHDSVLRLMKLRELQHERLVALELSLLNHAFGGDL